MLYDPLFILACLGVLAAIGFWIRFNLDNTINPRLEERLNFIGFIFASSTIWNINLNFLQSFAWIIGAIISFITYYLLASK